MQEIVTGAYAKQRWTLTRPRSIQVVDWNIDRGLKLPQVIKVLKSMSADLVLLQEVDLNARRTHHLNVAAEIARELHFNFVFGREFQELTQGTGASPAFQGQATLSPWPLSKPRILRFQRQSHFWRPRWYLPRMALFQERLGGRIALVVDVQIMGKLIRTYNLHLESRGDDALRAAQLQNVLDDAANARTATTLLVAGDLNLDASKRPAAELLTRAGFRDCINLPQSPTTGLRHLFEPGRAKDWAFVRGPAQPGSGRVHNSVRASDHYPISFKLSLS